MLSPKIIIVIYGRLDLLRFRSLDKNVFSYLGNKDQKKTNHGHHDESDHFRAQIESGMLDLDGPELLQFAMKFVQSALKKSQVGNQLNLLSVTFCER